MRGDKARTGKRKMDIRNGPWALWIGGSSRAGSCRKAGRRLGGKDSPREENNLMRGEPTPSVERRRMPGKRKREQEEEAETPTKTLPTKKWTRKANGLFGWVRCTVKKGTTSKDVKNDSIENNTPKKSNKNSKKGGRGLTDWLSSTEARGENTG